jgi:hypothetical protein
MWKDVAGVLPQRHDRQSAGKVRDIAMFSKATFRLAMPMRHSQNNNQAYLGYVALRYFAILCLWIWNDRRALSIEAA